MTSPVPAPAPADGRTGQTVVRASWAGTAVFTIAAVVAVARGEAETVFASVSLVLFGLGLVAFVWSFGRAVVRSQEEEIAVASLWFLTGSAPPAIRRSLLASAAVEVVVALAAASLRPFTPLAFGILVPVYGLGLCGVWAGRHGRFPVRNRRT